LLYKAVWSLFQIPESAGYVRTLVAAARGATDGSIYVGTTNNGVLQGSLQAKFISVVQVCLIN